MHHPLRVGVLLVGTAQLLDLAAVDLLYMTTPEYLNECSLPKPLLDMGRPCEIHYIGHGGADTLVETTARMSIRLTDSLVDSAVAPGKLDVVVIPGPSPKAGPPEDAYLDFVRSHNAAGTTILSICTGAFVIGYAGIGKGRRVTAPRLLVPEMKRLFPEAEWDDSVRVARDGNLWTSGMFCGYCSSRVERVLLICAGGITNGHDLVAGYLRENYPAALVNTILATADIPPRPAAYGSTTTSDFAYVLWQVVRAVPNMLFRLVRGK
jgi:putative intracellular protease/amidase